MPSPAVLKTVRLVAVSVVLWLFIAHTSTKQETVTMYSEKTTKIIDPAVSRTTVSRRPTTTPKPYASTSYHHLKEVSRQLAILHGKMTRYNAASSEEKARRTWSKLLTTMERLIKKLDPRALPPADQTYSAKINGSAVRVKESQFLCREMYMAPGYPRHTLFESHFEVESCSHAPPFREVMTVLLIAHSWNPQQTASLIIQLRQRYDVPIIVSVDSESHKPNQTIADMKSIRYVTRGKKDEGAVFNAMVELVETPFAFLAFSLTEWNQDISLERFTRVLDTVDDVGVAGGSFRDPEGHWSIGCLQSVVSNYHLTYTMGYHHSRHECMYCDDVMSPFAFRTEVLQQYPFRENLSHPGMLRDWFLLLQDSGWLVMSCPDVMFYLAETMEMAEKKDWHGVASERMVQDVYTYSGRHHHFDCQELQLACITPQGITESYLLSPCCLQKAHTLLFFVLDFAHANNLIYRVSHGSLLGAIKCNSFLPWDMDQDVQVSASDYDKWAELDSHLRNFPGCYLSELIPRKNFFVVCNDFTLDISFFDYIPKPKYTDVPTRILYAGRWIPVVDNPCLYLRNIYGLEYLRHAAHWRLLLKQEGTEIQENKKMKDGKGEAGEGGGRGVVGWPRCLEPGDHACLDSFPTDGTLSLYPAITLTPFHGLHSQTP